MHEGSVMADLTPSTHRWVIPRFTFESGHVSRSVSLQYTTLGSPEGIPVLLLHGSNASARSFLTQQFAGALFGAGQALDIRKYYLIIPDALGAGGSSKPSDGLRMSFPTYSYLDMVHAQHQLVTEHLKINHLKLVLGYSMGGMHTWLWAQHYPDMLDVAVPLACQPTPLVGRNWMLRRMLVEQIQQDPSWCNGNYETQPHSFSALNVFFDLATNGGDCGLYNIATTTDLADDYVLKRIKNSSAADANDHIYQWLAGRNYDASKGLSRIKARVLLINSDDDERNPVKLGILPNVLSAMNPPAQYLLLDTSKYSAGHATVLNAHLWHMHLAQVLANTL